MIDTFYIGAYWGSRELTLDEVTKKTVYTLTKLAEIDDHYKTWYELGMSKKKALEKKVLLESEYIEILYRRNSKKGEIDDLGYTSHFFTLGFWTGHKSDEESSITFNVGGKFDSQNLSNSCVIYLPVEGQGREKLLKLNKLKALFSVIIQTWNPNSVVLVSQNLKKALGTVNEIGWLTYYSKEIKGSQIVSKNIVSEKYENGNLIYLNLSNNDTYDYSLIDELKRSMK